MLFLLYWTADTSGFWPRGIHGLHLLRLFAIQISWKRESGLKAVSASAHKKNKGPNGDLSANSHTILE